MLLRCIIDLGVKLTLLVDCRISRLAFVQDLNRSPVIDGILKFVLVDVATKTLGSFLAYNMTVLNRDQRRSCEGQPSRLWKRFKQIVTKVARL